MATIYTPTPEEEEEEEEEQKCAIRSRLWKWWRCAVREEIVECL